GADLPVAVGGHAGGVRDRGVVAVDRVEGGAVLEVAVARVLQPDQGGADHLEAGGAVDDRVRAVVRGGRPGREQRRQAGGEQHGGEGGGGGAGRGGPGHAAPPG